MRSSWMKSIGWPTARSSRRGWTEKQARSGKGIPARNGSEQFDVSDFEEPSLLHAEVLKQQLGLPRQRRGIALMHHPTGFQNIDAVGDRKRAIEILLDQQDRQALAFQIKHDTL